ncbi:T9SS type A sorting domain-containing protein, partial [bacterium]|nr:T9SS type A sorting domain-containing protein [bacterium]
GRALVTLTANEMLTWIPFNAEGLAIYGISEMGNDLDFIYRNDTLWVEKTLYPGQSATIEIQLTAPAIPNFFEVGYHVDWQRVFTFAEPFGARRWFPCWDQPYDKFDEITIAVNMPEDWSLASNGFLISTTYPEPGRKREVYHYDDPISTYLIMIAAGLYSKRIETVNGIQYRYFTYPDDSADAVIDWEPTPQMVDVFSERFGDYPFAAYGMVEAGIFGGWGAMEHQTFTTYGYRLIDGLRSYEAIVAHELAHMWFGDYLSPVDFRNMWLNEGFATYFAAVWFEEAEGEDIFREELESMANAYFFEDEDELRYAAYDPPEGFLFGNVVYQKAGWVLHMLRKQLLGDELFYELMHEWTSRYAFGTVDTEDFISLVNEMSGEDYRWFFDQWIYQAGHPELSMEVSVLHDIDDVVIHSVQTQHDAPIFRYPLQIQVMTTEQTLTHTIWFQDIDQTVTLHIPGVVSAHLTYFQDLLYETSATSTDPTHPDLPLEVALLPAYPNPFNSAVSIPFELNARSHVKVSVYNLQGQVVGQIVDAVFNSGKHTLTFAPNANIASGVYLVRLAAGSTIQTAKIVLVK